MIIPKAIPMLIKGVIVVNETLSGWVSPHYQLKLGPNVAWLQGGFSEFHAQFAASAISTHQFGLDLVNGNLKSWEIVNEGYWVSEAEKTQTEACYTSLCHIYLKPTNSSFMKFSIEANTTSSHGPEGFHVSFQIAGPTRFYTWRKEISWRQLCHEFNRSSNSPPTGFTITRQVNPWPKFTDALFGVTVVQ